MFTRGGQRTRVRGGLLLLTLFSQTVATLGFPLPAASRAKEAGVAYPCQSRPCGCSTAEQCWAGDCCCFTLEEKLRWAETSGMEPPAHVRPLVESRKICAVPSGSKKKSCCSEADPQLSAAAEPASCDSCQPSSKKTCADCSSIGEVAAAVCPHFPRSPATESACCEQPKPVAAEQVGTRWVVGIFAQKCRGNGPAGLFPVDPVILPDMTAVVFSSPERSSHVTAFSERSESVTHSPPTRPPRSC